MATCTKGQPTIINFDSDDCSGDAIPSDALKNKDCTIDDGGDTSYYYKCDDEVELNELDD